MPVKTMPSAMGREPRASTTEVRRPSTINAKYSAGPNISPTSAKAGAKKARTKVAMVPAMKEPMPAVASATPARPPRAMR